MIKKKRHLLSVASTIPVVTKKWEVDLLPENGTFNNDQCETVYDYFDPFSWTPLFHFSHLHSFASRDFNDRFMFLISWLMTYVKRSLLNPSRVRKNEKYNFTEW